MSSPISLPSVSPAFFDLHWVRSHIEAHPGAAGRSSQRHCRDSAPRAPGAQQHLPEQWLLFGVRWSWLFGLFPVLQPDWRGGRHWGGVWSSNGERADPWDFSKTPSWCRRGNHIGGGRGWGAGRKEECTRAKYESAVNCIVRSIRSPDASEGASVQQRQQSISLPIRWGRGFRERRRPYPSWQRHPKHFLHHLSSAFTHVRQTHDITGQIPGQKAGERPQATPEKPFGTSQWASYRIRGGRDGDQSWPETGICTAHNAKVLFLRQWRWPRPHQCTPSQEEQVSWWVFSAISQFTHACNVRWGRRLSKSEGRFDRRWSGREELVSHPEPTATHKKKRLCRSYTWGRHAGWGTCSLRPPCWRQNEPQAASGAGNGWHLRRLTAVSGWVVYSGARWLWVFKSTRLLWGAESYSSHREIRIRTEWRVWWSRRASDVSVPMLLPRS